MNELEVKEIEKASIKLYGFIKLCVKRDIISKISTLLAKAYILLILIGCIFKLSVRVNIFFIFNIVYLIVQILLFVYYLNNISRIESYSKLSKENDEDEKL